MNQIWSLSRHEPLRAVHWDEDVVRTWIYDLVKAAAMLYQRDGYWPVHPRDFVDGKEVPRPNCLYYGSAGVIWALKRLETVLGINVPFDLAAAAEKNWIAGCGKFNSNDSGFLLGKGGTQLLAYALGCDAAGIDLRKSINTCGQVRQPKEIISGAPAALLMAFHAFQIKQEEQWLDLFTRYGQIFLEDFGLKKAQKWEWPQALDGIPKPYIGAARGLVGAMLPFMLACDKFPSFQSPHLFDGLKNCLLETVLKCEPYANWPQFLPGIKAEPPEMLLQWCHGAPGIVSCLSYLPSSDFKDLESLFYKTAETIWEAGPLQKPCGLCHGTAGNAYAFLRCHSLSRDALWLDRARSFAMHAIEQSNHVRRRTQRRFYSLFSGDLGLAVFLSDCITQRGGHFPVVESFAFA